MAGVGALISSLLSSIAKLLPEVKNSFFAPSSSSLTQSSGTCAVEDELNKLTRTLKRIKATLYDAEEREIRDCSVKLWLKELKEVVHAAEYIIGEYMYEVYRAKVEARNTFELNPCNTKQEERNAVLLGAHSVRIPNGIGERIREIRSRFEEIAKDREALRLHEEDGPRRDEGVRFRAPSSHLILEPIVFGRERDKENAIDLVFSNIRKGIITVVPIVGMGGLGKTTLAQLIYNERRVQQKFNLFGWTCVSDNFNVERLTKDLIESFEGESCSLKNLSALHEKIKKRVVGKNVIIVLDDIWNEDKDLWELFCAPFMSASKVAFIVTTRSDRVAKIVQTCSPFRLGYLPEEESWFFFQQYAFGGIDLNVDANLLDLGKKITKKCAGLPLAIKSISNLLRYENEESWVEILENDLWEVHAKNDIFKALQISYNHMPAYLRPCFLLCSLFPKDYEYNLDEFIELWIAEGYIESKGRKTLESIASEYALELRERSFFDPIYGDASWKRFKIHDMVHDLAQLNFGKEFCSIECGKELNPPDEVLHICMDDFEGLLTTLNFNNVARLRTLVLNTTSPIIDFSKAKSLRALILNEKIYHYQKHSHRSGSIFSLYHLEKLNLCSQDNLSELEMIKDLINLKFLSLSYCNIERIPDSLCFLSNLRNLSIKCIDTINILPEKIGNLVCLEKLVIHNCWRLCFLPESLCKLSGLKTLNLTSCWNITKLPDGIGNLINLQSLVIKNCTKINHLPCSFSKLVSGKLNVEISLRLHGLFDTISQLKDFNILKGTLAIIQLRRIRNLQDAQNFNIVSKPNLENLILSWGGFDPLYNDKKKLLVELGTNDDPREKIENINEDMDLQVLESLQPHPNLKHLYICRYKNPVFPRWMGDNLSCASVEKIQINSCDNIRYLSFGNLGSLKWLEIYDCTALETISKDSLPLQLQSLNISWCSSLLSITGLEHLEALSELAICECDRLKYFSFELISEECCHESSSSGLKNLSPLKKVELMLICCPNLQPAENEVFPSKHCNIEIFDCTGLKEWCLQHNISYKDDSYSSSDGTSDDLEEEDSLEDSEDEDLCDEEEEDILENSEDEKFDDGKEEDTSDDSEDGDDDNEEEDIVENSEDGNSDDSQEEDSEDGDLGDKEEEDILEKFEHDKLDDNKGKQIVENNEVRNPTSQKRQIPTGQGILKHMEKGSSSTDVINKYMEKGNSAPDED